MHTSCVFYSFFGVMHGFIFHGLPAFFLGSCGGECNEITLYQVSCVQEFPSILNTCFRNPFHVSDGLMALILSIDSEKIATR